VRHRRALVAPLTLQPPTVALRTTAALRPLQHPRCCNCSAAVALCTAATLCPATTAADAAAKLSRPFSCSPNSRFAGAVGWLLKFLVMRGAPWRWGLPQFLARKGRSCA